MASPLTTVCVIDDHEMVSDSLLLAVATASDMTAAGHATSIASGRRLISEQQPDVAVIDQRLPDGSGIDLGGWTTHHYSGTAVVILTGFADGAGLVAALEAGCAAYLSKEASVDTLLTAIRRAAAGDLLVVPPLLELFAQQFHRRCERYGTELTIRERDILRMLKAGRSTAEMAEKLYISPHTVRNHVSSILHKLRAHSRLEAVAEADRRGIFTSSPTER